MPKLGLPRSPNDCTGYRTPESYVLGSPEYISWLQCGLGGWSETGSGWTNGTGRVETPMINHNSGGGGASTSPPINQNMPVILNAPVPIPITIKLPTTGKQTPEPADNTPIIYHTTQQPVATNKLKEFYEQNQLLSLGVLAAIGYFVFVKK